MKQNIELDIDLSIDETVEIDETQFSKIVDMINKIGVEQFRTDNYLSGDTAEELAYEHCQNIMMSALDSAIWHMDDMFVDDHIISEIQCDYRDELDENKN